MSDDKALRILPGLHAGLTLKRLREVPRRFQAYCDAHPEYAREARPLEAANAAAARNRKGAHIRDKTHCVNGHLLTEHARVAVHKRNPAKWCSLLFAPMQSLRSHAIQTRRCDEGRSVRKGESPRRSRIINL
jgi:hypothetical protein